LREAWGIGFGKLEVGRRAWAWGVRLEAWGMGRGAEELSPLWCGYGFDHTVREDMIAGTCSLMMASQQQGRGVEELLSI
jgi:hypothetical protein